MFVRMGVEEDGAAQRYTYTHTHINTYTVSYIQEVRLEPFFTPSSTPSHTALTNEATQSEGVPFITIKRLIVFSQFI